MKCKHKQTILQLGNWGPHRAKRICMDCGAYIKWEKRLDKPNKTSYTNIHKLNNIAGVK
jgi:hypothetical protein